ncbi:MAG: GNAT family N-acetyltransferase [Planctomycetes bacterium]|nr:GNAT family N-acetyltransferase [Planctomycetota bacterium]
MEVDSQGGGLGRTLLMDAMQRCLDLGEHLGIHAVPVEAIDDSAKAFYETYGFESLADPPRRLYLPLATVRRPLSG